MIQESMTFEQIYDSKRDLALLEIQLILKQKIDYQELLLAHAHKKHLEYKILRTKKALESKYDYYAKYKETFDVLHLQKIHQIALEKQISSIKHEIRKKYYKLECDEIEEITKELIKQVQSVEYEIKSKSLKPQECIHCDEYGKYFLGFKCMMCGTIIHSAS